MKHDGLDTGLLPGDALLVVDVQNDFLPGGALAVEAGDAVVAPLNAWIERFNDAGLPIFATRCWHPADHSSFKAQGGPWPAHCVADTPGAAFPEDLALPPGAHLVSKGTQSAIDAYSGFSGTDLDRQLRREGIGRLFVGGVATDYCVLATVNDALRLNYRVFLLTDAVRAIEQQSGERAIAAMQAAGAVPLEV